MQAICHGVRATSGKKKNTAARYKASMRVLGEGHQARIKNRCPQLQGRSFAA
jgi:hypothetical protein